MCNGYYNITTVYMSQAFFEEILFFSKNVVYCTFFVFFFSDALSLFDILLFFYHLFKKRHRILAFYLENILKKGSQNMTSFFYSLYSSSVFVRFGFSTAAIASFCIGILQLRLLPNSTITVSSIISIITP